MLARTDTTAVICGGMMADRRRDGRPLSMPNSQIAASAIEHGALLATRNIRDFEGLRVKLVDPWLG